MDEINGNVRVINGTRLFLQGLMVPFFLMHILKILIILI